MTSTNPENPYGDRLFTSLERNDPAAGMLLLAASGTLSSEFARLVIFLIEHDEYGTFGVDLTQRSQTPAHNVLEPWTPLMAKPPVLYVRGSVNQTQPVCIGVARNGATLPEETDSITGTPLMECTVHRFALINLGAEPEDVRDRIDGARIFAGYVGWDPGQLEDEFERGDWYVAPALPSDILVPVATDIWGDCMRRQPWPLPLYGTYSVDVRDNQMSEHISTEEISPTGSRAATSDRSDITAGIRQTLSVGMELIPLGLVFDLLIAQTGSSWQQVPIFPIVAYAGSMELLAVGPVVIHTGLLDRVVTSSMVDFRHVFYGLTFLRDRIWSCLGCAYSTYALTDESYSIASAANPDEKMSGRRLLTIQILYQLLWAGSGIIGSLTGAALPEGIRGTEFVLVAFLTVLAMDAFKTSKDWSFPLSVIVCTLAGWLISPNQMLAIGLLMYFGMLLLRAWSPRVNRMMHMMSLSKGCVTKGERA